MSIACEADALHGAQTAGGHRIEGCTPSGIGRSRRPANKRVGTTDSAPTARKPAPLPACRLRSVPPKVASRATPEFQPSRYEPPIASQPRHATHQHTTHAPTRPRCQHTSCESIRLEPDPARTTHLVPPRGKQDFIFFSPKFLCSNIFLSSKFRLKFREISWIKKKPSALRALSHSHCSGGCVCTIYHIFPLCAQEINKLFARSTVGKHPLK